MGYSVNPVCLSSVFTLPASVADRHLKLANPEHIKVLIYIFRNLSEGINIEKISACSGVSEYDVNEALLYWADAGILLPDNSPVKEQKKVNPRTVVKAEKPSRADVAKRGLEDEKIRYLLQETQLKFGRTLKNNEANTLVWLYDDQGLDVSLILLIVQYAVNHGKANIRFIEQTAVDWINKGISTIFDAEEALRVLTEGELAFRQVSKIFGIERRKPSKKETEYSVLWINEWKISEEMLKIAYDECVNNKTKLSFSYIGKIIENWHKKGINSPDEFEKEKKTDKNDRNYAAYDIDLFEEMLNSKD